MIYVQYRTTLDGHAWCFKQVQHPDEFDYLEGGMYYTDDCPPVMIKGVAMPYLKEYKCYFGDFLGVDCADRRLLFQRGLKPI